VSDTAPLLEVHDLVVDYGDAKNSMRAVDRVNMRLMPGEFLGLVGESGCGKSTLCFGIAQLLSPPAQIVSGSVLFRGRDLVQLREGELRHLRWRDYSVVMQSAMNALNPVMSVGAQLVDAINAHDRVTAQAARKRAAEVLRLVGIDQLHLASYPHQLSGGMRQRAMIAMALVFTPSLIIMDEPTSALDVVGQAVADDQDHLASEAAGLRGDFCDHDMSLVEPLCRPPGDHVCRTDHRTGRHERAL